MVLLHPRGERPLGHVVARDERRTPADASRTNCIVVCVDGLTARSRGKPGESPRSLASVETIMAFPRRDVELSRTLPPVRRMYLYGTGTGADFALLFSQRFPAAGGAWCCTGPRRR